MYRKYFKRIIDTILALLGLVILSPIFILVMILLTVENRGTPFFIQKRPGKNTVVFNIIKFKTMNNKRDSNGCLLPDDQRITNVGSFIRKCSLDEIPQLLNILKGDMSIIGPRPLLIDYLPLYNEYQRRRHEVKPGITGLAQINGRNSINWQEKFNYDVEYVDRHCLSLDIVIFFRTIKTVIMRDGISSKTSLTMEKFVGN